MSVSEFIANAQKLLDSVKGHRVPLEERSNLAIQLAGLLLSEARRIETSSEKAREQQLAEMMCDPVGKPFTFEMTDRCFRSHDPKRVVDLIRTLLDKYGTPHFLSFGKRLGIKIFQLLGHCLPNIFVPLMLNMIRKEMSGVILPGEENALNRHMLKRRKENVRVNLNHLGEAILGEQESLRRLDVYLKDLEKPHIEYISIKISTIYSQISLLAWDKTLEILKERLRLLYRKAMENYYITLQGQFVHKFVNLDMEEYRDLHLTVQLFKEILSEDEFKNYSAGIVLQSYLPDSFAIQKNLTEWASQRCSRGGAPIKIRIVKGANLAMEQCEAGLKGWIQAPYKTKLEVDANFKKMILFGFEPAHIQAVHIGIGSHNLFDIAFALLLKSENQLSAGQVTFEMLEGMADHLRRAVHKLSHEMLLYSPVAKEEEFSSAVAYLVRRLDENTGRENFLKHSFKIKKDSEEWIQQAQLFSMACRFAQTVGNNPRRKQDRNLFFNQPLENEFHNEADTDFSLAANRTWLKEQISLWTPPKEVLPLSIGKQEIVSRSYPVINPSDPARIACYCSLAQEEHIDQAIDEAHQALKAWSEQPPHIRSNLLFRVAEELRKERGQLIAVMVNSCGKTVSEADAEISEAIDFAEYYRRSLLELHHLTELEFYPKGITVITPPWNFPCAIPIGCSLAALVCGNTVILKPSLETPLIAWSVAKIFWKAGIPKEVFQFITCEDEPVGSKLIGDPRVSLVVLTGSTATAHHFFQIRPDIDLIAETGGKNAIIVSATADRDAAVKEIIHSAFSHAGQKCSAASLLICEKEVYHDSNFMRQLADAASSLKVGPSTDLQTYVPPLIHPAQGKLLKALTSLEVGEEWLIEPKNDPSNPHLWSPGIKLGVRKDGFIHQNELFGPVLGVMCAENLEEAVELANGTPYGLTAGLFSLDEKEQQEWMEYIQAGNCYINRGITGAIVRRQPFGGCKESSFGRGLKAGGSNYLLQMMQIKERERPNQKASPPFAVQILETIAVKCHLEEDEVLSFKNSVESYTYWYQTYFNRDQDPSLIQGEDNFLRYLPYSNLSIRLTEIESITTLLRAIGAALITYTPLDISLDPNLKQQFFIDLPEWTHLPSITFHLESENDLIQRIQQKEIHRLRFFSPPPPAILTAAIKSPCKIIHSPIFYHGRIELLNFLRELSLSIAYHRYGNLGVREKEQRNPIL